IRYIMSTFVCSMESTQFLPSLGILANFCRFALADSLLVAETYASIAIDFQNLYQELITFLELIRYLIDTLIRYLRNMQEAIGTRKNFNKGSKIHDFSYSPQIDMTNL